MSSGHSLAAILVAGGSGSRFGAAGGLPKQFQMLAGYPLYTWSISRIYKSGVFKDIILTMPGSLIDRARREIDVLFPNNYIDVIAGGASRQESVHLALRSLASKSAAAEYVVVHDAARPFLTLKMLEDAIATVTTRGACTIGTPVSDTLKKVAPPVEPATTEVEPRRSLIDGLIIETVDRRDLYSVQTPQAAPLELLLACHERARAENLGVTDDAAILEHFGHRVVIFPGQTNNIKITVGEDLRAGELLAPLYLPASPH
ncbi:MAG: 2-C-methyl-D-erythritol 4-phosphate cytidylyltransferase [Cyanobacteria bacterium REEB67]|nr:2-C-methyl-D-erythritol 4-phosphate cytidylyltransferase [Cyanobacteria bacterium REEB67]